MEHSGKRKLIFSAYFFLYFAQQLLSRFQLDFNEQKKKPETSAPDFFIDLLNTKLSSAVPGVHT